MCWKAMLSRGRSGEAKKFEISSWSAARMFTAKASFFSTQLRPSALAEMHTSTSAGSSETDENAFAVIPYAGPGVRVVTTVTPVANEPRTLRKSWPLKASVPASAISDVLFGELRPHGLGGAVAAAADVAQLGRRDPVEGDAGRGVLADRLGELVREQADEVHDLAAVLDGRGLAAALDAAALVPVAGDVVDGERDPRVLVDVLGRRRLAAHPHVQAPGVARGEHCGCMGRPLGRPGRQAERPMRGQVVEDVGGDLRDRVAHRAGIPSSRTSANTRRMASAESTRARARRRSAAGLAPQPRAGRQRGGDVGAS